MRPETKARIRDRRKPGWCRIDNEIIDVYGPEIGCHGIAVYAALSRHADKDDETSHPGLRLLCKELKIGRRKLLDTLEDLKKCGLIDIEPGDRKNVNVYTLLDVPKQAKGGSNENHPPEIGGSNENQGGSEKNQGGGSNENHNKTQLEQDPIEQEVVGPAKLPDDTTTRCLQLLLQVKGFPRDQGENALKIAGYRADFPGVDPIEVCQDFKAYIAEKPFRNGDKPRLRLRNFFKQASKRTTNGKPPGEANVTDLPRWERSTPPEIMDYVFENTRTDYIRKSERRLRSTMARFDFTSEEQPPWKIEKELGGSDSERWSTLDALRSLCRRGQRELAGTTR